MGGLREKYKIAEFRDARQALDGYYGSINTLAWMIKGRVTQEKIDEQGEVIKLARRRLQRAIEGLGFTIAADEKEQEGEQGHDKTGH